MTDVIDVIDRQVAAYMERNLEGLLACYTPDIRITDVDGNLLMDFEGMRGQYAGLFRESPNLTGRISNRIVVGGMVIDERKFTACITRTIPRTCTPPLLIT